jgi:two-component system OmpR family sensor kinase
MTKDRKQSSGVPKPMACRENFFKEIEIEFLIHELKDPISIVETGAQMLLKKQERFGPLTERQTKTINRIIRNAAKARQMLYSLLEVGRAETGSFSCIQFDPALASFETLLECLDLHAPATADKVRHIQQNAAVLEYLKNSGIFFTVDPAVEDLRVRQDEIKFRQIAGNLIKNALHYRAERLELRLEVANNVFAMAVIDDGPGIPEKYQQSIFKRYTQAAACRQISRNGHGLGLAGARTLARSLGGDIHVSSRENEGATFRLTMPLQFAEPPGEK